MADRDDGPIDEPDEATLAFRSLAHEVADVRAELSVMRRAVEGIGPALAEARSPDYSPTLAELTTAQQAIAAAVAKIERHPALRGGPEAHVGRIARATEEAVRGPLRDAESAAQSVRGSARDLESVLGSGRVRAAQNRCLAEATGLGLAAGLVLFPLIGFPLARALPFGSLPDTLAASALGADRWGAGMGLMQRTDPQRWNALVEGYRIARAGGDELKICYETASRTGKQQQCMTMIRPPAQP